MMSWAGHVARMEKTNIHRVLVAKYEGTILCGRPRIGGKIILKWIVQK
jgi:hypothetical protein